MVLGALGELGHLHGVPSDPAGGGKRPGGGHFQGGRGRQPGPQRHVAGQHALPAGEAKTGLLQAPGRALKILEPAGVFVADVVQGELARLVVVDREDGHAAVVSWLQGDPYGAIDRQRQDEAVVVVGVFAEEIDSAWGADDPTGCAAETGGKLGDKLGFSDRHGT